MRKPTIDTEVREKAEKEGYGVVVVYIELPDGASMQCQRAADDGDIEVALAFQNKFFNPPGRK